MKKRLRRKREIQDESFINGARAKDILDKLDRLLALEEMKKGHTVNVTLLDKGSSSTGHDKYEGTVATSRQVSHASADFSSKG